MEENQDRRLSIEKRSRRNLYTPTEGTGGWQSLKTGEKKKVLRGGRQVFGLSWESKKGSYKKKRNKSFRWGQEGVLVLGFFIKKQRPGTLG